jgi:DeoR/GlpR family transcriptional regulator of sugar metabolism
VRVPLHIVQARRERLRELIRQDGFLPVAAICRLLGVSEATARRDLASVAANGQISRTRGGALADYNTTFASLGERANRAKTAKGRIAAAAARLVPAGGTIFLDAGTTVCAVARALLRRKDYGDLTVVTNSLAVANILGGTHNIELHVLGGTFLHRQAVLFGEESILALGGWRFDSAFLGGEGMDADGLTNSHQQIAAFQRAVLMKTPAPYFCLDGSKLGKRTPYRVSAWDKRVRLITDLAVNDLVEAGIDLSPDQLFIVGH